MSDLLLLLDPNSPIPPYEQIREQLWRLIASGQLPASSLLPSVRQLASDLGVAPNTVVRAYNELEREGWVVTSARRGVMVAARPPVLTDEERARQLEGVVAHLLMTAYHLGVTTPELYMEINRQINTHWPLIG